ncbi:MAG: hypothetical protein JXA08_02510 [Methanomicrobiaceae archaeon]|nr:hypothetical protein [Methanomicrobiaceae archaeon]
MTYISVPLPSSDKSRSLPQIFRSPRIIALIPASAVFLDYLFTFFFAGSAEMVLRYEFSPLVKIATAHGLMVPYLLGMMLFYYLVAWAALRILSGSPLYPAGAATIILVSLTHVLGGLSWYVQAEWYSYFVHALSLIAILVALAAFAYSGVGAVRTSQGG